VIRLERVDPCAFSPVASSILEEAWPAPHLRYSPEYLRWQFTFPGRAPRGIAAFDGDEAVGFVAMTPRRLRFRGLVADSYIYSFGAVRPAWRGRRLAVDLYASLLEDVAPLDLPVLGFVLPDSPGYRTDVLAARAAGGVLPRLGTYPTFGYRAGRTERPLGLEVAVESEPARVLGVMAACDDHETVWAHPDAGALAHYATDPRPRTLVSVRREDGRVLALAWVVTFEVVTPDGGERVNAVDSLFLPTEPTADTLVALFEFAARRPSSREGMLVAPNLSTVAAPVLAAAGARRIASGFWGVLHLKSSDHPFAAATRTNIEVV
jgi:GNAT superfamily N-acetyltransferase